MTEAAALLSLQDLDLRLLKLASSLAKMPQQARLKTIELARKKVAAELTGIIGQRKDAQIEIEETEAELILMKVGEDENGEYLDIVEDDEELYKVSKMFEKRLQEFFDIEQ